MSKLIDVRTNSVVKLPSFPEDTIEMYDGILTHELKEMLKITDDFDRGMFVLTKIIKSWSFTDENDKVLPINESTISMLPTKDFNILMTKVGELISDSEAKKSKS